MFDNSLRRRDTSNAAAARHFAALRKAMHRRSTTIGVILAAALSAATVLASDPGRERQLQQAIDLLAKNQLSGAAAGFEEVARSDDLDLAARGLFYLATTQERLRKLDEARQTYSRIIARFGRGDVAVKAKEQLARLAAPVSSKPKTEQVVTGDDADPWAYITLDGRFLSRADTRTGDIVVREMRTGQTDRLMAKKDTLDISPDRAELPMISPDGRKVAFVWALRDEQGRIRRQLRVMPREEGASARVLVDNPERFCDFAPIAWSPDGQSVLVTMWSPQGTSEFAWISVENRAIRVLKPLARRLGRTRPHLSPDGKYVAYSALPSNPATAQEAQAALVAGPLHIYVLPADFSGDETELVRANLNESPVWTPDSKRILFVSNRDGEFALWSVAATAERRDVSHVPASIPGRIRPVRMTSAGKLYFVKEAPGGVGVDVFLADVDPASGRPRGKALPLLDRVADRSLAPSWSPDGERVAFKRRPFAGMVARQLERVEVVVYSRASGREEGPFVFEGLDDGPPQWLDDPRYLLVRRVNGGLFRLNLATGDFRPIELVAHSTLPPECGMHALSPDGRTLYLSVLQSRTRSIVAFDLTTGDQRVVLAPQPHRMLSVLAVSPNGRALAALLVREDWKAPRLVVVDVGDGKIRELPTTVVPRAVSWTPAGLLVAHGDGDQTEISRLSLDDGSLKATGLTQARGHSFDISRDGLRLVYSDRTRSHVEELWGYDNLLAHVRRVN